MMQRAVPVIVLVSALLLGGCGAMAELENENQQLALRVDALELENAECAARVSAAAERMSVLEQENLRLDEVNRRFTAREVAAPSGVGREEVALPPPEERGTHGDVPPGPVVMERRSMLAGFTASTAADEQFLSRYQAALSLYNAKQFAPAVEAFTALLEGGARNDMVDNCGYWIGECRYALGLHEEAVRSFTDVIVFSAVSDKYDDALMMRANCHIRLKNPASAARDYQAVIAIEPPSEFRTRAQQKLKALR